MSDSSISPPSFEGLLTKQEAFSNIVKLAQGSDNTDSPRVDLLYLRFKENIPDDEGLAEILVHQVPNYAIPRRKLRELAERAAANPLDLSLHSKLIAEAKRAFIAYKEDKSDPGQNIIRYAEMGEVVAFCVASHFLEAGQVAAKMALKTNSEMPVFGLDGIHIRTEKDNTVTVFFLEAKMVGEAVSGGEQYSASAATFGKDRSHKLNEQRIARDLSNLDVLEDAARGPALEYFDPYGANQGKVRERFVGVIIYTEEGYEDRISPSDATPLDQHEKHFLELLKPQYPVFGEKLKKHLVAKGAEPGKCRAYYLAVPDIAKLKKLFAEAMTGDHIR